jgi:dTDP-4-amino-4,6-dideoxygalactose transaminase
MVGYGFMILADAILTLVSIILGMLLRLDILYSGYSLFGYFLKQIGPFIIFAVFLRPTIFYFTGIYRHLWRYASWRDFFRLLSSILLGSLILSLATLLIIYPLWMKTFPRSLLILEGMFSLFLLGGWRIILKFSERYSSDLIWDKTIFTDYRRVLIVGAGSAGSIMSQELWNNPQLNLRPVALLDDDPQKIGKKTHGLQVFGPIIKLPEVIQAQGIDEVIIAIPSAPEQTLQNISHMCQEAQISYYIVPPLNSILSSMAASPHGKFRLPMSLPQITGEEIHSVVRVMQSRNLSIGVQTIAFEKLAAEIAGTAHAVAVTNGTAGLHLCMIAAGIGPGDEVITTPFSFIASANCILYERAVPVFVDIDPETLNIDPEKIEQAITNRTRAIIVVHVFGQPADMDPILEIAQRHKLLVIEDACEAIGAEYKGKRVGALGKAGVYAFYPNKQATAGEGAVLVTNDEEWANLFRSLRNQGRDQFDEWLMHSRLGYNYRLSELNAAVGMVQLKRIEDLLSKRESVANEYRKRLRKVEDVSPLRLALTTTRMSWFVYPVRFSEKINRDLVMSLLAKRGIPSRPYFGPIHLQPFYGKRFGFVQGNFPESEKAGNTILALPFHTDMNPEEVDLVCETLAEVVDEVKSTWKPPE